MTSPKRKIFIAALLLLLVLSGVVTGWDNPNENYRIYSRCWYEYEPDSYAVGLFHLGAGVDAAMEKIEESLGDLDEGPGGGEFGEKMASGKKKPEIDPRYDTEQLPDGSDVPAAGLVCQPFTKGDDIGRFDAGIRLEGKTSAIVTPTYGSLKEKGHLAVEAWFKPEELGGCLFWLGHRRRNAVFSLNVNDTGILKLTHPDGELFTDEPVLTKGQWRHVALVVAPSAAAFRAFYGTLEGGNEGRVPRKTGRFQSEPADHAPELRIVVDGRIVARQKVPELRNYVKQLKGNVLVGNDPKRSNPYRGVIDELRVSDRARKYYPYDLAKTRLTAGPDFPLGQPYLRDEKEQKVHVSFKEGLIPVEMQEKAADRSYPEKTEAAFVPGVHDRAAKTGPRTRTPAYGFSEKFSARSATLEFWFSPYDWDNGLARPKPEGNAEQRVVKYRPLRAPYQVVPLVGISSGESGRSDKERWLVRISAHQMWTPLRHHTPSTPPEMIFRPGTWYHLTITIDHGRVRVYVNGEPIDGYLLDIQTAAAPSDHTLRRVVFGRAFPWKRRRAFARGKQSLIDEVRLYSRPLTPPEIKNLYARYMPEVKEQPLPFAHSVLKLQPVRRRAVSDVTLLGPERDRVNMIQMNVTDANGQLQLERSLPPLKDGRTWAVSDGVFVPTETFNTTWVFRDKDGAKLHRQQKGLERPEFDPYRTAEQPPFNLAYYPSMKSARIQFNPVWEMGTIRSDFLTSEDGRLGLDAHYYADPACEGDPVTRQVDPEVGFKWKNSPAHNISPDYFGVIWTGTLGPIPYEGEYLIRTVADSGTRLWIDGEKVIDCWPDAPKSPKVVEIAFEKESRHELKMQYGARGGESKCYLEWRLKNRPPASNQDPASMHVLNAEGETLIDRSVPIGKWCEQLVEIGPVPDGVYRCEIKMPGGRKYYPRWFERRHFVWEENQLGITRNVYAPFEPIKVNEDEVGVVMRRYRVGGLGFWKSVRAKGNETPFREILAAPIVLEINDGKVLEGNGEFTKTAAHEVVYEGTAQHPAVSINSRCITEYDGCMRVELTLEPGQEGQELENLSMRIPIKDEMAPLWHTVKTRIRGNPAGRAPRGTGKVWDSRRFRAGAMPGNFLPYIWLGAEERGICWFADNERGWVLDRENKDPCLTLERNNGVLSLRVHLVQKPVGLKDKRRIVLGIMASPGKPMPENWRKVLFSGRRRGFKSIGWSGSTYWGCAETMHETYPLGRDFDVLNKFQEVRLTGKKAGVNEFKKAWERRHLSDYEPKGRKQPEQIMGLVDHMINFSWRGQPDYRNVYWEEFFSVSWHHPETQMFLDEWYGDSRFGFRPSKSYLDFQCWYGAEFIRRGIGLYFDNTFPKGASNPYLSTAYRDEQGRIHNSARMWWHREYLKRIWVLHQQLAPAATKPIMMFHMTNSHMVPYMTFGQTNLDLEWRYGPRPAQAKYSPDLLRVESIGLQTGNIPLVLADTKPKVGNVPPMQMKQANRTKSGVMWVHEIRFRGGSRAVNRNIMDFGYGLDDCSIFNYWDANPVVKTSDPNCKWLLLKRNDKLLLLLCTWAKKKSKVDVDIDLEALEVDPSKVIDVEHPEADELDSMLGDVDDLEGDALGDGMDVKPDDKLIKSPSAWQGKIEFSAAEGKLKVPIDRFGVRMIRLE